MVKCDCQVDSVFWRSIFGAVDHQLRDMVCRGCTVRRFGAGDVLCEEGDRVSAVLCIKEGFVKQTRTGEKGVTQVLRLLGPSDVLGLAAALEGVPQTARGTALSAGTAYAIQGAHLEETLRASPDLALAVVRYLARESRTFKDLIMALSQRPVRRRVADVLLLLHGHGVDGDDWNPLPEVVLKRKEIAQMVSATPESVSRVLAEFADQGFIRISRMKLELRDPAGLQGVSRE